MCCSSFARARGAARFVSKMKQVKLHITVLGGLTLAIDQCACVCVRACDWQLHY